MVYFHNSFVFQSLLKDEAVLKTSLFFLFLQPALTIPFPFLFFKGEDEGQPEPALTIPFPVNKFPYKLASKVPDDILKKPRFCLLFRFQLF